MAIRGGVGAVLQAATVSGKSAGARSTAAQARGLETLLGGKLPPVKPRPSSGGMGGVVQAAQLNAKVNSGAAQSSQAQLDAFDLLTGGARQKRKIPPKGPAIPGRPPPVGYRGGKAPGNNKSNWFKDMPTSKKVAWGGGAVLGVGLLRSTSSGGQGRPIPHSSGGMR